MYAKMFIEPGLVPLLRQHRAPWAERRRRVDVREFEAAYLRPRRPVVLTDALQDWQALRVFTPNFFRQRFANVPVQAAGHDTTLGAVIDAQQASRENPGPYPCTLADCTELLPYVTPRFACSMPSRHAQSLLPADVLDLTNRIEIRFSGPDEVATDPQRQQLHLHAWLAQVHGEKEITLYEPDPQRCNDALDQPPRVARSHRVVLRAGDALFVPAGIWYAERSLGTSITVAFAQLEASNWEAFVADVITEWRRSGHRMRALAYGAWLRLLGPVLRVAEWLGAGRDADWGRDGSTGWKAARRCPAHRH